jgi:hypothetical protein
MPSPGASFGDGKPSSLLEQRIDLLVRIGQGRDVGLAGHHGVHGRLHDRVDVGGALAEAGIRVPEDMSIVGYDDQEDIAAALRPPLTTLRLPYYEMGRWALEQILAGTVPTLPPRTYLPCPVVTRGSVTMPSEVAASS